MDTASKETITDQIESIYGRKAVSVFELNMHYIYAYFLFMLLFPYTSADSDFN